MKPALYNTTSWTAQQRELAEKVYRWLCTVGFNTASHVGTKFEKSTGEIRQIIDLLMLQERIVARKIGKNRLFGINRDAPAQLERARTWKPLTTNPQLSARYREIQEYRAAYPSKHI